MNFSGYVGYGTRNNLEHFGDDRFNPLGIGFLFLFSRSVFVDNITEYRMDGHSWNFQDMDTRRNLINFGPTNPIQILNQHEIFWRFCMCPSNDTFDKNKNILK